MMPAARAKSGSATALAHPTRWRHRSGKSSTPSHGTPFEVAPFGHKPKVCRVVPGETKKEKQRKMSQLKTELIPLLPLNNGVVLPGMVVTIPMERGEAKAAVAAARGNDRGVLLVPRV